MFWLFLLLFLFPRVAFATPTVTITNSPTNVVIGDTFAVTFSIGNTSGISYHYKIVSSLATDLITEPNPSCDSSYDLCDSITVGDTNPVTATAYAKITTTTGTFDVKIRIAQSDNHSKTYDSGTANINPISPTPTQTLTPTNSPFPTSTSSPTNTPTNTPTPTIKPTSTLTPAATATITPIPTPYVAETPVIEPTSIVTPYPSSDPTLGTSDIITPTIILKTTTSKSISPQLVSIIFIVFGSLLLFVPIIILKLKK